MRPRLIRAFSSCGLVIAIIITITIITTIIFISLISALVLILNKNPHHHALAVERGTAIVHSVFKVPKIIVTCCWQYVR